MNNEPLTPAENLTAVGFSAVGTAAGVLVGLKYKHPVVGFVIGSTAGSLLGLAMVVSTRMNQSSRTVTNTTTNATTNTTTRNRAAGV